jgi:hypothetical protein
MQSRKEMESKLEAAKEQMGNTKLGFWRGVKQQENVNENENFGRGSDWDDKKMVGAQDREELGRIMRRSMSPYCTSVTIFTTKYVSTCHMNIYIVYRNMDMSIYDAVYWIFVYMDTYIAFCYRC